METKLTLVTLTVTDARYSLIQKLLDKQEKFVIIAVHPFAASRLEAKTLYEIEGLSLLRKRSERQQPLGLAAARCRLEIASSISGKVVSSKECRSFGHHHRAYDDCF